MTEKVFLLGLLESLWLVQTGILSRMNGIPSLAGERNSSCFIAKQLLEYPVTSPALREFEWPSGNSGGTTVD